MEGPKQGLGKGGRVTNAGGSGSGGGPGKDLSFQHRGKSGFSLNNRNILGKGKRRVTRGI